MEPFPRQQKSVVLFSYHFVLRVLSSGKLYLPNDTDLKGIPTEYIQGRDEIGGVYLPSQLKSTLQLCT
jgi:hypothetical protein